jgi:hypothetical protein
MGTARRQYTDEFKQEEVGLLARSGRRAIRGERTPHRRTVDNKDFRPSARTRPSERSCMCFKIERDVVGVGELRFAERCHICSAENRGVFASSPPQPASAIWPGGSQGR